MTINGPVIAVGECMIELSGLEADDGRVALGFAGDTCNTAIYLARLLGPGGPSVRYRHGAGAGQPVRADDRGAAGGRVSVPT
jgi:hypothetical protein